MLFWEGKRRTSAKHQQTWLPLAVPLQVVICRHPARTSSAPQALRRSERTPSLVVPLL